MKSPKKTDEQTREQAGVAPGVEGEGSYTATRKYNADLQRSIKEGHTRELAEKARKAVEGPEGPALCEAERVGRSRRKDI